MLFRCGASSVKLSISLGVAYACCHLSVRKSEHGTRLETEMHYSGGGEAMSTTTQRRPKPNPLSGRGRCVWMSLSLTSCKLPSTRLSLETR